MPAKLKDDTLDVLSSVLDTTEDARKGYRKAAEEVKDLDLGKYLGRKAHDRDRFSDALRALIEERGQDPGEDGTVLGALHRIWIDLRAAFASDEGELHLARAKRSWFRLRAEQVSERAEAMVKECCRGERHSLDVLREALGKEIDDDIRELLDFELEQIEGTLDEITSLLKTAQSPSEL